ncbi:MAG: thioesterase family protein, partial [Alistipes sp.]|nr:thioesterase family protein [Alistipes sp.]
MKSFDTHIRVEYHHTDQMGIVHHSNYVKFFEFARTEWLHAVGLTYAEMERRGVMMPIVEV